jgi:hypothetical protein
MSRKSISNHVSKRSVGLHALRGSRKQRSLIPGRVVEIEGSQLKMTLQLVGGGRRKNGGVRLLNLYGSNYL